MVYWDTTCAEITNKPDMTFSLNVFDNTNNNYNLVLSSDRMFVDGKYFDGPGKCFLPVLRHF